MTEIDMMATIRAAVELSDFSNNSQTARWYLLVGRTSLFFSLRREAPQALNASAVKK